MHFDYGQCSIAYGQNCTSSHLKLTLVSARYCLALLGAFEIVARAVRQILPAARWREFPSADHLNICGQPIYCGQQQLPLTHS
jgi:hypothetical protein